MTIFTNRAIGDIQSMAQEPSNSMTLTSRRRDLAFGFSNKKREVKEMGVKEYRQPFE